MGLSIAYVCDCCKGEVVDPTQPVYRALISFQEYARALPGIVALGGVISQDPGLKNRQMLICNACKEDIMSNSLPDPYAPKPQPSNVQPPKGQPKQNTKPKQESKDVNPS